MVNKVFSHIKLILMAIAIVIAAAFAGLTLVGCNNDYTREDAIRIARRRFGCEKILWIAHAHHRNNLSIEFPGPGGFYVIGTNKAGEEVYVAVPQYETDYAKITTFEWPFDYTFAQIAEVYAEYGYKYADGVDGRELECIRIEDIEGRIKTIFDNIGVGAELYDKLDVKLMFELEYVPEGEIYNHGYLLTQESGALKMYTVTSAFDGFKEEIVRTGNGNNSKSVNAE